MFYAVFDQGAEGKPYISWTYDHLLNEYWLQERFLRQLKASKIPKARDASGNVTPQYNRAVINTHGAVLGLIAMYVTLPIAKVVRADIHFVRCLYQHTSSSVHST